MSDTPRKSGIRLPWSSATGSEDEMAPPPAPDAAAETPAEPATPEPTNAMPPAPAPSQPGPSPELLRDLVNAMRGVVTATRDESIASLRSAVSEAEAGVAAATVERQAALRSKAEADIAEIGAWERAEIERVRGEAVAKVSQRRAALDQELAEAAARQAADLAAVQARLDSYTGELTAFMAELDRISDPAAFAAAARRMPVAPAIGAAPPAPLAQAPVAPPAVESLPERLAELDQQLAEPAAPGVQPGPTGSADASTSIVVRGLGSFGAITSFKQALEGAPGVSGVALALGPAGEFVYTITHAPATDMAAAVRSVEPDAEISGEGGSLQVKVQRPATR